MKTIRFFLFGILLHNGINAREDKASRFFAAEKQHNPSIQIQHSDYPEQLRSAEKLYKATLYIQAIPLYKEILQNIEKNSPGLSEEEVCAMHQLIKTGADNEFSNIHNNQAENAKLLLTSFLNYRLGYSHFQLNDFAKAYNYFTALYQQQKISGLQKNALCLFAASCRHLKNYQKATEILLANGTLEEPAHFELALNYYLLKDYSSAQKELLALESKCPHQALKILIRIYLCRTNIAQGMYNEAAECLKNLQIDKDNPLHLERTYLQGEVAFLLRNYQDAIAFLTESIPKRNFEQASWYFDTLYYLGWSHLKMAADREWTLEEQKPHFDKTEEYFTRLIEIQPSEKAFLALAQYYLIKGMQLKNTNDDALAEKILSNKKNFITPEAQTFALLLSAEKLAMQAKSTDISHNHFQVESQDNLQNWIHSLSEFIDKNLEHLPDLNEPQKFLYLYAMMACHLAEIAPALKGQDKIEKILNQAIADYPHGDFTDACLYLLATYYFKNDGFDRAEQFFNRITVEHPQSEWAGEALYWSALCAEKLKKDQAIVKEYRKKLFENYPTSPLAASAFFQFYTFREYLQGDLDAIKHLRIFKKKFPNSPLQINSYYLVGLDYKRERKSSTGCSLRKKNLTKATAAFSKAEQLFDDLYSQNLIPQDQLEHYVMIRYRALLERALANQAIAEESHAAKRKIYFQYAQELFAQIYKELSETNTPFADMLKTKHSFPQIQEESLYFLIQSYIKLQNYKAAEQAIDGMIATYTALNISKNYYLSRIYYEKGMLAMRQDKYDQAWISFMQAEKRAGDNFLSTDEKLDLWIQESECCKALNQTDKAMLILSKVINDNTISSLRVKAMYLRASVYVLQGRHDLARKQLAATAAKGGEWANKAKLKLEEDYGFQ